jgi:hypothetical protein
MRRYKDLLAIFRPRRFTSHLAYQSISLLFCMLISSLLIQVVESLIDCVFQSEWLTRLLECKLDLSLPFNNMRHVDTVTPYLHPGKINLRRLSIIDSLENLTRLFDNVIGFKETSSKLIESRVL